MFYENFSNLALFGGADGALGCASGCP